MEKDNIGGPSKYICFKLSKVMRKVQRYYENKRSKRIVFFIINVCMHINEISIIDKRIIGGVGEDSRLPD